MKASGQLTLALALVGAVVLSPATSAQDPQRQAQRGAARNNQRPALPPDGAPADPLQVQQMLDAWAIVQAQRELQLSEEQYPNFVTRLTRLHNLRRRVQMARRQMLGEMRAMMAQPTGKDEALTEKVKAFDELRRKEVDELQKAFAEIDGVLTPWQRARFRMFEEQIERRKIEMLRTIGAGRAGGAGS